MYGMIKFWNWEKLGRENEERRKGINIEKGKMRKMEGGGTKVS